MNNGTISIDRLIGIVKNGGKVKTGVDIYNKAGVLLLDKDVMVDSVTVLETIKENGVNSLPVYKQGRGGIWNKHGNSISLENEFRAEEVKTIISSASSEIQKKVRKINELRKEATEHYMKAKGSVRKVLTTIQQSGGEFEYDLVEDTVSGLLDFMTKHENGFSYLTKEIFSFDDYLHNHSVNVCIIGTAIISHFNKRFNKAVNESLAMGANADMSFCYLHSEDLMDISAGFFLHDIGKILVPPTILNKKGRLTEEEFDVVRRHSYEKGLEILEKNNIKNPFVKKIVTHHHANLFENEPRCYPEGDGPALIPIYVKICKLADIYDAMTSKRSYKEAFNPINVVTEIFRTYAKKDNLLQFILYSFVKSIGIYPAGSVVMLENGQYAYILDPRGPLVLPFTDLNGTPLDTEQSAINLSENTSVKVDSSKALLSPVEAFEMLPPHLKALAHPN